MLQSQETAMTAAIEKHLTLEVSISQRLKWAAGANPSLNQVAVQFEEILSANKALLQVILLSEECIQCRSQVGFGVLVPG